ncbi:KamA family radical SAM protein, partial [bacterium]|nr:KamA family radical SAM protein [bacterium]
AAVTKQLRFGITPFYAQMMLQSGVGGPLWKQVIPDLQELEICPHLNRDPLDEEADSPVSGLIHRYDNRVVLLLTDRCAVYCRYCNRRRRAVEQESDIGKREIADWIRYLSAHPGIHEVILSGGDPLTWTDARLAELLKELKKISSVEIVRICSRMPVTLPFRITEELCITLNANHPIYLNLHINHSEEITPEFAAACHLLTSHGIPLGSQTVLLRGVNDQAEILIRLYRELLKLRVKPYALYQADPAQGTAQFRVSVIKGRELMREVIAKSSGLAVPHYIVDVPRGVGKIPILPDFIIEASKGKVMLRSLDGREVTYYDGDD